MPDTIETPIRYEELTADEMLLRRFYFSQCGNQWEMGQLSPDLIQYYKGPDMVTVVASLDNIHYSEGGMDTETFEELWSELISEAS